MAKPVNIVLGVEIAPNGMDQIVFMQAPFPPASKQNDKRQAKFINLACPKLHQALGSLNDWSFLCIKPKKALNALVLRARRNPFVAPSLSQLQAALEANFGLPVSLDRGMSNKQKAVILQHPNSAKIKLSY